MIRKKLAFILAAGLTISATACSNKNAGIETSTTSTEASTEETTEAGSVAESTVATSEATAAEETKVATTEARTTEASTEEITTEAATEGATTEATIEEATEASTEETPTETISVDFNAFITEYQGPFINFAIIDEEDGAYTRYDRIQIREDSANLYPELKKTIDVFNQQCLKRIEEIDGWFTRLSYYRADGKFFSIAEVVQSRNEEPSKFNDKVVGVRGFNYFSETGAPVKLEDILTDVDEAIRRVDGAFTKKDLEDETVSFVVGPTEIVFIIPTGTGEWVFKPLSYYGNKDIFASVYQPIEDAYISHVYGSFSFLSSEDLFFDYGQDGIEDVVHVRSGDVVLELNGEEQTILQHINEDVCVTQAYMIYDRGEYYLIFDEAGCSDEWIKVYRIVDGKAVKIETQDDNTGYFSGGPIAQSLFHMDDYDPEIIEEFRGFRACVPVDPKYLFQLPWVHRFGSHYYLKPISIGEDSWMDRKDDHQYVNATRWLTAATDLKVLTYPDSEPAVISKGTDLWFVYYVEDKFVVMDPLTQKLYWLSYDNDRDSPFINGLQEYDAFSGIDYFG